MTHLTLPPTREGGKLQPAINEQTNSPCAADLSAARRGHEGARHASLWGAHPRERTHATHTPLEDEGCRCLVNQLEPAQL